MASNDISRALSIEESRRDRLKELFYLLTDLPAPDRDLLLDSEPSVTPEERAELRMLLSANAAEDFFEELSKSIGSLAMADRSFAPADLVASRFRVTRFLGAGGMGEVYSAQDLELHCEVALKVLRPFLALQPQFVERFRSEIRLSRSIVSLHVCRVFDVARHTTPHRADTVFYTMELLEGETLAARIRRDGPLPAGTARRVAAQLLEGMDAAHRCGVLHCDFKSANVMLCGSDPELRAIVTDFGLARLLIEPALEEECAYTAAYAAPEQLQRRPLTRASDVFSLGVVLYQLTTGQLPFDGEDRTSPRPFPSGAKSSSREWERIILSCLDPSPEKRPRDLSNIAQELRSRPSRRWFVAGGLAASVIPAVVLWRTNRSAPLPSIAVRPFDADGSELGARIANATANRISDLLTKIPGLRVVSQMVIAADSSRRTGVDYLVAGKVRSLPAGFEMRLELVEAGGTSLWSQTRAGLPVQLESMYREAVLMVAQKLRLGSGSLRFQATPGVVPPEAYANYLLARYHAENRDLPSIKESIRQLQEAIRIAPEFAAAHAWLGMCYYLQTAEDNQENRFALHDQAGRSARKALELDPLESDAHIVLGLNDHLHNFNWRGAEEHFRRAVEISPSKSLAHHRLARLLSHLTRHSEAIAKMEIASTLDFGSTTKIGRGMVLLTAGRIADAITELEGVASADPGHFNLYVPLSSAYFLAGRLQDAREAAMQAVVKSAQATSDRQPMTFALAQAGFVNARMGRAAEARMTQAELERRYAAGTAEACEVAFLPAGFQLPDDTVSWLERGYTQRSMSMATLLSDPMYRFLAGNKRFQSLLSTLNLRT